MKSGADATSAQPFRSAQRMPLDLPLRCRCGRMRGVASDVSPSTGLRVVCYCKDCQAFARFLERPDVLDPAGGTDIFQMPPGRVKLTAGTDAMRCLRLSNKVLRWYTDCCRTPIANTPAGPRFPVIGVVHSFMDHAADGRSRDEALGPPLCRIYEDRKSTRLNSSHMSISYAVFCLKKKTQKHIITKYITKKKNNIKKIKN